jgi:hypothetical protein
LFFREALNSQLQLSPSVDAAAHMSLQLHLGEIQFLAIVAFLGSANWFPNGSEIGNWISVEESFMGYIIIIMCFLGP